jgi:hypothetical protein
VFTHSSKIIQCNQEVKNKRRDRTVLSRLSGFYRLYRTTHTKTKEQVKKKKKKTVLFWKEKETHSKESVYIKPRWSYNLQIPKHRQRGRKHDYRIYKKNHPDIPKDVMGMYDLGFLGVENDFSAAEQKSSLPIKKEKGCELTAWEKEYNRNHSRKRIVIEHTICRIKKYRIMNDIFRNRLRKYDRISDIVSGLMNYRIMNTF